MNYYQHHIGDFIRDTARLSDQQCMAYLRLIWMYYDTEQPLQDNPKILAFKTGASEDDVRLILEAYFSLLDGKWHHSRCDQEISDYWKFCETQRVKGKLGGRPKKKPAETREKPAGNPADNHGEPDGNPEKSPENPIHYPLTTISNTDVLDNKRASRFSALDYLIADGVEESVAKDWIAHRKAKKASPTETAIKGIKREAEKAGITLSAALAVCCERGWQGFNADWLTSQPMARPIPVQRRIPPPDDFSSKNYGPGGKL